MRRGHADSAEGVGALSGKGALTTYAAFLEVTGIRPHQVPLKRKIDAFSPQEAGAALAASSARFPHSDDSADSDLDASR